MDHDPVLAGAVGEGLEESDEEHAGRLLGIAGRGKREWILSALRSWRGIVMAGRRRVA